MNELSTGTSAKIFLADERDKTENDRRRSYCTFNSGTFFNQHKMPFNRLYAFNDETLAPGSSYTVQVPESSFLLILPVVGGVQCDSIKGSDTVDPGQLLAVRQDIHESVTITNSSTDVLINFIQILISVPAGDFNYHHIFHFDVDDNKNKLLHLTGGQKNEAAAMATQPVLSIGKFKGREEAGYHMRNPESSLFVFVIEGVFEVQGRLLHQRDGLGLWNIAEDIEMEALSNDAIVLTVEF